MFLNFSLPSWMSLGVAHSHEISLKLAAEPPEQSDDVGFFLNSEKTSEIPVDLHGNILKNRSIRLGVEIDADGSIKE